MYTYILYDSYLHFNHIVIEWQQKSQQIRPNPRYDYVIPLLYVASHLSFPSFPDPLLCVTICTVTAFRHVS